MSAPLAVVVLGHRLEAPIVHAELAARLQVALDAFPHAELFVVSGGATEPRAPPEAELMREWLLARGVASSRILAERRSLDTIGNAYFTRLALADRRVGSIEVVTSCYHRDRAQAIFARVFGDAAPVAASRCASRGTPEARAAEAERRAQGEAFFAGIAPGDLRAISRRLRESHLLYRSPAFADLDAR